MDRALIRRLALPIGIVVFESLVWQIPGLHSETFAPDRIVRALGSTGVAFVVAAAVAFALWWRLPKSAWALALAAIVLHVAFVDLPQAQPDTATYLIYAGRFARDPLGTLLAWPELAWSGDEARFHTPFPLVPLVYGLVFAALGDGPWTAGLVLASVAVALPFAVAALARAAGEDGPIAAWLALSLPFLQAQSGWILVDLPFTLALCVAWAAILRARTTRGVALAAGLCLLPLAIKLTAPLYLAGPIAARLLPGRFRTSGIAALSLLGLSCLAMLHPPRLRSAHLWLTPILVIVLHLRPSLWTLGLTSRRSTAGALLVSLLVTLPVIALYAPAEHAARYALPLAPALCVTAAAALRDHQRMTAGIVGSGLVLLLLGYRPLLVHNQALNLQVAVRQIEADGATGIEVWGDHEATTFPPLAVAVMVDYYATVPVRYGGEIAIAPPDRKRHWWEFLSVPPWLGPGPADRVLLSLYGPGAARFERTVASTWPETQRGGEVALYSASSLLWPQKIVWYRRPLANATVSD